MGVLFAVIGTAPPDPCTGASADAGDDDDPTDDDNDTPHHTSDTHLLGIIDLKWCESRSQVGSFFISSINKI